MKRKLPSTSLAANAAAVPEMRMEHHQKILDALAKLQTANYEKIAANCGLDRHQVGRRLKEMEGLQLVYKPGLQSPTSSGRLAYNYSLTNQPPLSVSEQVEAIIENATKPTSTPLTLF